MKNKKIILFVLLLFTIVTSVKAQWTGIDKTFMLPKTASTIAKCGSIWYDTTYNAFMICADSIRQPINTTIFIQTENKTIENTTTETSQFGNGVGILTLPVNFLKVGKTIKFKVKGFVSAINAQTSTIRVLLDGDTLLSSTGLLPNGLDSSYVEAEFYITCRSVGVNGTVEASGRTLLVFSKGISTSYNRGFVSKVVTINTTQRNKIDYTYKWDNADVGNVLIITDAIVEVIY